MRTIFIADAHLRSPEDANYRLLLRFLHELEGKLDSLYVMGDLFDFWLGFPSQPFRHYDEILDMLQRLVDGGCRLVYFEGNHDFHLGDSFSKRLKAEVHVGPAIELIQGKRLFLCHGDQINRADSMYLLLRLLLHSRPVAASVSHVPPAWALRIREKLQERSRAGYSGNTARWDYRRILLEFASEQQKQGLDGLVTGHFHIAMQEHVGTTGFMVLSLGDWMQQFTYGEMLAGELCLKTYSPASATS